ncbi:MAG: type VI secretion system tip protein VgrG [Planctomycetes bacterium]|nr:type VI secretion system tip protein VgrG [Planctomycetota bacterium]
MVPKLWFLTRSTNCKIYQNKSVADILQSVLSDFGITDLQNNLTGTYNPLEYCVQYRETAFQFLSRLMEQAGIFYFFLHDNGKHTLVLGDATSAYQKLVESTVSYSGGSLAANHIGTWEHQFQYRSGKWAKTDYNFETPSTSLLSSTDTVLGLTGISSYELFDYPGGFLTKSDGTAEVKLRMEEEETPYDQAVGASACCTFSPGGKFTLQGHDSDAENQEYLVTVIEHTATDPTYLPGGGSATYANAFTCIPSSVVYRPARLTPRPVVQGPQPAVVVGQSGEEIYTDKYGRIKVQFFWDRLGTNDENSSCWMRVTEEWAGKNWGQIFTPRIGQEVIVSFLEGDPDRPIITGRVYNADQMPPYTLPDNMTQSGLLTRSTKEGATDTFNELRFEDKKDSEEVYFHAQKDFTRIVENNDVLQVGYETKDGSHKSDDGSQTIKVYKDRTETVETGNETVTIQQGNRSITVSQGNDTHEVKQGNREVDIDQGNDTLNVKQGKRTVTVNGDEALEVKTGNRTVTVDTGNDTHQVKTGNREVKIDTGNDTLTVALGNQSTKVQAGSSTLEALQGITLKVGPMCSITMTPDSIELKAGPMSSIKLDATGVTIKGMMVSAEGQVQSQLKGLMTTVQGEAMLQAKGAITMIGS